MGGARQGAARRTEITNEYAKSCIVIRMANVRYSARAVVDVALARTRHARSARSALFSCLSPAMLQPPISVAICRRNGSAYHVLQSASGQMTGIGLILGTGLSTISDRARFSFAVHVPAILGRLCRDCRRAC